jgi:hypothetical protein
VRYAPVKGRPSTLSGGFIKDLLEVTGGGKARDFWNARDHAMIRVLTEGARRAELVQMRLADLPADLIPTPYVRVVPPEGRPGRRLGRRETSSPKPRVDAPSDNAFRSMHGSTPGRDCPRRNARNLPSLMENWITAYPMEMFPCSSLPSRGNRKQEDARCQDSRHAACS